MNRDRYELQQKDWSKRLTSEEAKIASAYSKYLADEYATKNNLPVDQVREVYKKYSVWLDSDINDRK